MVCPAPENLRRTEFDVLVYPLSRREFRDVFKKSILSVVVGEAVPYLEFNPRKGGMWVVSSINLMVNFSEKTLFC